MFNVMSSSIYMMTLAAQRPPQYANSIITLDASRLDSRDVITLYGPVSQVWDRKMLARRTEPTVGGSWWNSRGHTPDRKAGNGALTQLLTGELDCASGTDLSLRSGHLPYAIRLMDIATRINYRMLANVLLRDQLVSQDLL
ncbi:predicted protein [Postia placenta Mad-698-R]|nr:predicted protein [Postia placenta Mad-698-R]